MEPYAPRDVFPIQLACLPVCLLSVYHSKSGKTWAFSDISLNSISVSHLHRLHLQLFSPPTNLLFKELTLHPETLKLLQRYTSRSAKRGWQGGPHIFSFGVKADRVPRENCGRLDRTSAHTHAGTHTPTYTHTRHKCVLFHRYRVHTY